MGDLTGTYFNKSTHTPRKPGAHTRTNRGAAIVEGVVSLYLIVTVSVLLILFLINVGLVLVNQQKVNAAAIETARFVMGQRFFIGMEIPDPTGTRETTILSKAKLLCNGILSRLGLPAAQDINIDISDGTADNPSIVTARVTLAGVPLFAGGGVFPSAIPLTGTGAASQESNPVYGIAELNFADQSSPGDAYYVWVPVYLAAHQQVSGGAPVQDPFPIPLGTIKGQYRLVRLGSQGAGLINRGITDIHDYVDGNQTSIRPWK
jgi:hypothetical protein